MIYLHRIYFYFNIVIYLTCVCKLQIYELNINCSYFYIFISLAVDSLSHIFSVAGGKLIVENVTLKQVGSDEFTHVGYITNGGNYYLDKTLCDLSMHLFI